MFQAFRHLDFYLTGIHAEKLEKIAKSVWMPGDEARGEGSHKSDMHTVSHLLACTLWWLLWCYCHSVKLIYS